MPQVPEGHLATQTYLYIPGKTGQAAAEPLPWESETSENPRASPLPGYKLLGTPSCWCHTQPWNCVSHVPGQVPRDLLPAQPPGSALLQARASPTADAR